MRTWSARLAACVALTLVAAACGGAEEQPTTSRPPASTGPASFDPGQLADTFRAAGITVVGDPGGAPSGEAAAPVLPVEVWTYQLQNMQAEIDAGSGFIGTEIDALLGDIGGMPFSYLLAAWLSERPSPVAGDAADIMGEQDWEQAPNLIYPTAVLALFLADAARAAAAPGGGGDAAGFTGNAIRAQAGGLCSTLTGWVNDIINSLFDLLHLDTSDDGLFGWLAVIWNAAVELAQAAVEAVIEALGAPIVEALRTALFIVGVLTWLAPLLQPWQLDVSAADASTRFAVGTEPDIRDAFIAEVDTGFEEGWPDYLVDCAAVIGVELPDPSQAAGSPVAWEVAGLPPFGTVESLDGLIDTANTARADWITGREERDDGEEKTGVVSASVRVEATNFEQLKALIEQLIADAIPVPPFGAIVTSIFSELTAPIFDALTEMIQIRGSAQASVTWHFPEEIPCIVGTWRSNPYIVPPATSGAPAASGGGGVVVTVAEDGTVQWDFAEAQPVVLPLPILPAEYIDSGTAEGTATFEEDVWVVTSLDVGGMTSRVSTGSGTLPSPLLGAYVLMTNGAFTCTDSALAFATADANGQAVHVSLDRVGQ